MAWHMAWHGIVYDTYQVLYLRLQVLLNQTASPLDMPALADNPLLASSPFSYAWQVGSQTQNESHAHHSRIACKILELLRLACKLVCS